MSTYLTLRDANRARQAEWDPSGKIGLTFRATELAGEVGEACNVIKKLERERLGIEGSRASGQDLAAELADVVICADLIAMDEGIDLDQAVAAKFNATSAKVGLATRLMVGGVDLGRAPASRGGLDVLAERRRQVAEEGRDAAHDDEYLFGELAAGGVAYALFAAGGSIRGGDDVRFNLPQKLAMAIWPWSLEWWKPKDKRRDLVRAAALIIAEIDRLDRKCGDA